ncbi:hypothetical protein B0H13DRAFT_2679789 [Mycena leptocephala]|nr:hypothetical protein B0H13DRAFT_2679789 [Mycena leptocephala]
MKSGRGRPSGKKNLPGHNAGGVRAGSGRKRVKRNAEPEPLEMETRSKRNNGLASDTRENTGSAQPTLRHVPNIPELIPPEITPEAITPNPLDFLSHSASPVDSDISLDDVGDQPAEDTPNPGGAVENYLDRRLKEIMHQTRGNSRPQCYKDGTFWIRPPNNWFILDDSYKCPNAFKVTSPGTCESSNAPNSPNARDANSPRDATDSSGPEGLYYPPIFVWLPTLLVPPDFNINCVFCGKDIMTDSGWNSNPVARRVVDLDSCYYILTRRVKCRKNCQKSCNLYNAKVLEQFPPLLRNQFPAFLTHRSGIDKRLMTLIRSTIAQGLTPNTWERVLRELHIRNHDLSHRDYLNALKAHAPQTLPSQLTPFSSFSDKEGYAGFSPSRWYISKVYVEYMSYIKPHHDQAMSAVPLTIGKMDQSYKVIKYLARMEGNRVFGSLWTITNEFEQIRQMILTPTRHLTHVERPLRDIMKSLHKHGHQPISLLWTDNVRADHQFVERVVPTLRVNVDHETTDGGRKYQLAAVPDTLKIRLASSISLIDESCRSILSDLEQANTDTKAFVGFSIEWDWQASKAGHFPAALMQIAISDFVYLFQIYHICRPNLVPESLKILLFSKQVIKVGHHVQGNLDISHSCGSSLHRHALIQMPNLDG